MALVFLVDDFDAVVFFSVIVDDLARTISRTVVNKNNFEVFVCLVFDGIEAGLKIFFGVIDWDDNRNFAVHVFIIAYGQKLTFSV